MREHIDRLLAVAQQARLRAQQAKLQIIDIESEMNRVIAEHAPHLLTSRHNADIELDEATKAHKEAVEALRNASQEAGPYAEGEEAFSEITYKRTDEPIVKPGISNTLLAMWLINNAPPESVEKALKISLGGQIDTWRALKTARIIREDSPIELREKYVVNLSSDVTKF